MMQTADFQEALQALPLYVCEEIAPKSLEFSQRVRHVCKSDCPMYAKSWACPPAVGEVEVCRERCLGYERCLLIGTVTECDDISNLELTLATRQAHERITDEVADLFRQQGIQPFILSTEACAVCARCAYLDGQPCRQPGRMHPCIESHGINLIPALERMGLAFQYGENIITWYSLLFFNGEV